MTTNAEFSARPDFDKDAPIRLDRAAKIAFPDGSMTAKGLRKERDKGRLLTEIIAGKEYTTLGAIDRMRELCRVQPRAPASPDRGRPSGSVTDRASVAHAAAVATLEALRRSLPSRPQKGSRRARKSK